MLSGTHNTLVKMIRRGSDEIIPNGQTQIMAGDMLVLAVDQNRRGEVYDMMKKLQGVELDG